MNSQHALLMLKEISLQFIVPKYKNQCSERNIKVNSSKRKLIRYQYVSPKYFLINFIEFYKQIIKQVVL